MKKGSGGSKAWIAITIAIFIVVAFAGGITLFRQTHAIWDMNSSNACTINTTLNSVYVIEPILVIVVVAGLILALASTKLGFS